MSPQVPGGVELPGTDWPSPAELLKGFIDTNAEPTVAPGGIVVGGADDNEQQAGCVALMDAGDADRELYAPIISKRVQVRCLGPTLYDADRIGNYMFKLLHNQRWLILADHLERLWFCHTIYCTVGSSHHIDNPETHESLFFAAITIGDEPVGVPES